MSVILRHKIIFLIVSFIMGIFFVSCGLEDVITVNEPKITNNNPLFSSDDYLSWYCDFIAEESNQPDTFIGTEIFYKIYNNSEDLESQRKSITSVNTTSNASAAATKLIDTYSFQPLGARNIVSNSLSENVVFVPAGKGTSLQFRLKTYKGMESYLGEKLYSYKACIIGSNYGTSGSYIPFRNGNTKSFDFFDDDDNDKNGSRDVEPIEGDRDYYHSTSFSEENTYYVQLFAVSVAFDTANLSNAYSIVLDLGSIPIKKGY